MLFLSIFFLDGFVVYNKTVRAGLCTVTALSPPQSSEASHFMLIAGEPIREPVVQYGALLCYFLHFLREKKYPQISLS